jgi:hypothetical protein
MTGRRQFLHLALVGAVLFSGVTLAATLDNEDEQVRTSGVSFVRPIVPDRADMVEVTTTTSTTSVAALPAPVPVATTVAPARVLVAAAVTTTTTTTVKVVEEPPPVASETVSAPATEGDNCMGWLSYVEMRGLPVDTFCGDADDPGIIWCESRGNPNAQNGQHAGLTQLAKQYHEGRANRLGYAWSDMHDGSANLHVASDLYNESGLSPWYPSKYCWG